jgi:hypothetical protein
MYLENIFLDNYSFSCSNTTYKPILHSLLGMTINDDKRFYCTFKGNDHDKVDTLWKDIENINDAIEEIANTQDGIFVIVSITEKGYLRIDELKEKKWILAKNLLNKLMNIPKEAENFYILDQSARSLWNIGFGFTIYLGSKTYDDSYVLPKIIRIYADISEEVHRRLGKKENYEKPKTKLEIFPSLQPSNTMIKAELDDNTVLEIVADNTQDCTLNDNDKEDREELLWEKIESYYDLNAELFNESVKLGSVEDIMKTNNITKENWNDPVTHKFLYKTKTLWKSWNNSWNIVEFEAKKINKEILKAWKRLKVLYSLPIEYSKEYLGRSELKNDNDKLLQSELISKYIVYFIQHGEDKNSLKIKRLEELAWFMFLPNITRNLYK